MKKIVLMMVVLVYGVLLSPIVQAKAMPAIPADCFEDDIYCSSWEIAHNSDDKRVISVKVFAKISADDYETVESVEAKYFDFAGWMDYVRGSDDIEFSKSQGEKLYINGELVYRHTAHYVSSAPWPIRRMNVKEYAEYRNVTSQYEGSLSSWKFRPVAGTGFESEGLKYKDGEFHISYDEEENVFLVRFHSDIIPALNILPRTAAPFVQKSILAIFKGMLDL